MEPMKGGTQVAMLQKPMVVVSDIRNTTMECRRVDRIGEQIHQRELGEPRLALREGLPPQLTLLGLGALGRMRRIRSTQRWNL
jgi:hypothetical protein